MACIFQVAEDLDQVLYMADVHPARGVGQGGGPHFDYDSHVQTAPFLWSGPPEAAVRSRPVTGPGRWSFHRRR